MVQVCATARGVATAERLRPNVLSVPAVILGHSSHVGGIDQKDLAVFILAIRLIGIILAVTV